MLQTSKAEPDVFVACVCTSLLTIMTVLIAAVSVLKWNKVHLTMTERSVWLSQVATSLRCPVRAPDEPEPTPGRVWPTPDEPEPTPDDWTRWRIPDAECIYADQPLCQICGEREAEDFLGGAECWQCYDEH